MLPIFQVLAGGRYDEDTHACETGQLITSVLLRQKAKLNALGIERLDSLPGSRKEMALVVGLAGGAEFQ